MNRGALSREKAGYYNDLAQNVFFPVYPVIANQILEQTGIDNGRCLDAGGGPGHLAIALATLSDLKVCTMDNSRPMCRIAEENIRKYRLEHRVRPVFGTVNRIPFDDASFDLVVSRGAIFFWNNLSRGFSECLRVLQPGGMAYIGSGFGNARLREEIRERMRERDPAWEEKERIRSETWSSRRLRSALTIAGIADFDIVRDDSGYWVLFRKPGK